MNLYKEGAKIKVINACLQSYGLIGTIIGQYSESSVLVYFKDWNGEPNKTMAIKKKNIIIIGDFDNKTGGNSNMKVTGNYDIAQVKFLEGYNTYDSYSFALFDKNISVGDKVLCDTRNGYVLGEVYNIVKKEDYVGVTVTKEIICQVDFSEFEKRKENRKKKETLKKRMDEMVKENQELVLFQMLAEKNPEMKVLLDEYNSIAI